MGASMRPVSGGDVAMHERDIAPVNRAHADSFLKKCLRMVVFCREHEAGGIHIEAMDDTGAIGALHGAQVLGAAMPQQGVGKRVVNVTLRGMAHQTALLGKDDEVFVLIADIEGNLLGLQDNGRVDMFLDLGGHIVVGMQGALLGSLNLVVDAYEAFLDGLGRGAAARIDPGKGQILIEAYTLMLGRNTPLDKLTHGFQPPDSARHATNRE